MVNMKKRPINKNGYQNVVFDCDSTLSKIEGADELARKKGVETEVSKITKLGMEGKIPFEESLERRLNILKPTKKEIKWLAYRYLEELPAGTWKVATKLKELGKKLYAVSGGYTYPVTLFTSYLGIEKKNIFAVDLKFDKDGNYQGFNRSNPLSKNGGKRKVIGEIAKKGRTMLVGDGASDLEAYEVCDLFVGYGGVAEREVVKKGADIYLEEEDLTPIIKIAQGKNPFDAGVLGSSLSRAGTEEMQQINRA